MAPPFRQRTTKTTGGIPVTGAEAIRIENILPKIERTFLSAGTTLGKYRIIEEIDRGGMAVVYKALQLDLDRIVALKVLPANITINRRFVERFQSEAHAVAKLSHPNIVSIHEVSMEDNVYFLAMDYISGKNLFYYLNFEKPKLVEVLEIVATLADALSYAHQQKIVHRDLKLNNVIMKDNRIPVLIDFGLAKALESDEGGITQTGEIVGSPAYMAPERLLGHDSDHRSDICSLGIMLYEMLTFKNPYLDPRSIHQTTLNILESNPIPPRKLVPWLHADIEAVTLKAMHKDLDKRYQTMAEFGDDIRRYQRGEPVKAKAPSLMRRGARTVRRHWAGAVIGLLAVMFSVLFGASLYLQEKKEQPRWQLVFEENFSGPLNRAAWTEGPRDAKKGEEAAWTVREGALRGGGAAAAFIRLEKPLTRDILIEFDIRATGNGVRDAGMFLYGDDPQTGYCFHLLRGSAARSGIAFPGQEAIFADIDAIAFPAANRYRVAIRREGLAVSMTVNGVVVASVKDYFPPLGKQHQKIGFFVGASPCEFDNLRIYRLTIPQLSSSTLVADRFWERGDIEGALEEYRSLLVDYPRSEIVYDVHLRIADCLMRLGHLDEAGRTLDSMASLPAASERMVPATLLLKGTLSLMQGDLDKAKKIFGVLSRAAPDHPASSAACLLLARKALDSLAAGRAYAAAAIARDLPRLFPQQKWRCGMTLAEIMRAFVKARANDTALALGAFIEQAFAAENVVLAHARLLSGIALLEKKDKRKAVDAFNRCIGLPVSSEALWQAWEMLAQVYQYDYHYADARAIYARIQSQCPRTISLAWMARIRHAELSMNADTAGSMEGMLAEAAHEHNPFPLSRCIALYYLNRLTDKELKSQWERHGPQDAGYLYCYARKAAWEKNFAAGRSFLGALLRQLPSDSWEQARIRRIIDDLARW